MINPLNWRVFHFYFIQRPDIYHLEANIKNMLNLACNLNLHCQHEQNSLGIEKILHRMF